MKKKHNLLIKLKDGRIGIGFKYKYKKQSFYFIDGYGFRIDDVEENDVEYIKKLTDIFSTPL